MKNLVVSVRSFSEVMDDLKQAFRKAYRHEITEPHYEISFDNRKDFERFVRSIPLIYTITKHRPKSVYELAKITGMDVSNLNKVILFLEEMGAIRLKSSKINGRSVKTPIVEYQNIEFRLAG